MAAEAEVRNYVKTSGREGVATISDVDAERLRIAWHGLDKTLLATQLMSDAAASELATDLQDRVTARAATPEPPPPAPTPTPTPEPGLDTSPPIAAKLTGTAGDGAISLSWEAATDNVAVSRYEVWMNNAWAGGFDATARSFSRNGLSNGTAYAFRVVAYDAAGNYANSNTVTLTPTGATSTTTTTGLPAWPGPLVLDEQFTSLDTARWSIYTTPGDHADEPGVRAASAWSISNGQLVCTATNQADGQIVTGGMSMRLDQRGGRWQFRVRTDLDPTGSLSGVVLLWPKGSQRRSDGEIDIYETERNPSSRRPYKTYVHWGSAAGDFQTDCTHDADAAEWHTMTFDWLPDRYMRVYRDDVLVKEWTDPQYQPIGADHLCIQFDAFAKRTLPGPLRMQVDWVKVFAL